MSSEIAFGPKCSTSFNNWWSQLVICPSAASSFDLCLICLYKDCHCEIPSHKVSMMSSIPTVVPNSTKVMDEEKKFRDCADLYQAGIHKNGVYTIQINPQETKKVRSRNIIQPACHCNVNVAAFSSPLGRSYIRVGFFFWVSEIKTQSHRWTDECEWWVLAAAGIFRAKNTLGSFVRGKVWNWTLSWSGWWQVCAHECVCGCGPKRYAYMLLINGSDDFNKFGG